MRLELLKILLVDDNPHMRTLLGEILRAIGVQQIVQANDGAEGLQLMRTHNVDIVITDLAMQPLDGIDFVRLLRKTAQGFVATKNGATLLDADARCPLCSTLQCKAHPVRYNLEAMRHTRGVMLQIRKPKRAA